MALKYQNPRRAKNILSATVRVNTHDVMILVSDLEKYK